MGAPVGFQASTETSLAGQLQEAGTANTVVPASATTVCLLLPPALWLQQKSKKKEPCSVLSWHPCGCSTARFRFKGMRGLGRLFGCD